MINIGVSLERGFFQFTTLLLISAYFALYVGGLQAWRHEENPNKVDSMGRTLLMAAASKGDLAQVQYLCSCGAHVNVQNKLGASALMLAVQAEQNRTAVVHELLVRGADVHQRAITGVTPLHFAVLKPGGSNTISLLIKYGADVNAVNENEETPLLWAVGLENLDAVTLLLEAGADPNKGDDDGHKPLEIAVQNSRVIELLLRKHGANDDDFSTDSPAVMEKRIKALPIERQEKKKLLDELKMVGKPNSHGNEENHLRTVLSLPWNKYTQDNLDLKRARTILDEDHYGLNDIKEQIIDHLAVGHFNKDGKAPILCFVGPPGIGKTSLGKSIARCLERKYERIALGGVYDETELRGHRRAYIGSAPGRIVKALVKAESMNPIILLDEVDKVGRRGHHGDPCAALLEILDPEQNHTFHDNYIDIPLDLSKVLFVATANDLSAIPAPLRNRMAVVDLSGYTTQDKMRIAQQHLIKQIKKDVGFDDKNITIESAALKKLIESYTRESGVRQTKRHITTLMAKLARVFLEQPRKRSITIAEKDIEKYLGPATVIKRKNAMTRNEIGITNGLYWSPVGGGVLPVEALLVPRLTGDPKLKLTGQLQSVMEESAHYALSYALAHADELGIDKSVLDTHMLHIHVPDGSTPKDGPSAGVTLFTSIVSVLSNRPVNACYAMTGEINLRGQVSAIGGVREKVLGAKRDGLTHVILPAENKRDIIKLNKDSKEVVDGIEIVYVHEAREVLEHVLCRDILPIRSTMDKISNMVTQARTSLGFA